MKRKLSTTRQELFDNTINYFNSENRGIDKKIGRCVYISPEGNKKCAIGIELKESLANSFSDYSSVFAVFYQLPERLQKLGKEFLGEIQNLHDDVSCWDEKGLSEEGILEAKNIAIQYDLKFESK